MDAEIIQGFIEEAESYLPGLREKASLYQSENSSGGFLKEAHREIHTIKGAAMMVGLPEISEVAKGIEEVFEKDLEKGEKLSPADIQDIEFKLTLLEAMLLEAKDGAASIAGNMPEFSFEEEESSPKEDFSAQGFEDFEVDAEMLEVFQMEAEDHLRNIAAQLELLENNPNNREALLEIRRSSHTLKGAAGICGFQKISDLSHRVEDLLDYLADNDVEGSEQIFNLLLASTDCLERLATGENTDELNQKIGELYIDFSANLAILQGKPAEQVSAVSEAEVSLGSRAEEEDQQAHQEEETETETLIETVAEKPLETEAETAEDLLTKNSERSVVRVSVERLDEIVKLVGEMVLSRSVFEQRIAEFERQIQELQHTTGRLRRSTNKLEIDFEASTLTNLQASPLIFSSFTPGSSHFGLPEVSNDTFHEFDSLEFDRYTEFHQTTRELIETATDTASINSELDVLLSNLETLFSGQRRLIDEMQEKLLRLRMVPLSSFAARLQRTVRVTANQEGKSAEFVLQGQHIEIDTQIVDALAEPLLHLLRNAIAHGIETPAERKKAKKPAKGRVTLRAYSEGTHIVLTIADDGRGITPKTIKDKAVKNKLIKRADAKAMSDEDAMDLIFLPGFSTAKEVSQVSGRGVGMNIVKTAITRRQGTITVKSEPGKGTTFTLRLPMAMAVTRSLLVRTHGQPNAFPLNLVTQVVEASSETLEKAELKDGLRLGNTTYKVFYLNELLGLPVLPAQKDHPIPVLLIETPELPCALVVDQIIKPQEIVIKPLGKPLQNLPHFLGATILGDGNVVPVLDLMYLLKHKPQQTAPAKEYETPVKTQISVMIVDDSPSVRRVMSNLISNVGWQAIIAKDGLEALDTLALLPDLPDVILSDVEMPRMDGYEFLSSVKRNPAWEDIPVIMITSRAGDKHRQKAHDLGVTDYIVKPYEDYDLLLKIENLTKKV